MMENSLFSSFQGTSTFQSPFFHLLHFLLLNQFFLSNQSPFSCPAFLNSRSVQASLFCSSPLGGPEVTGRRDTRQSVEGGRGGYDAVVCAVHLINRQLLKNSLWPVQWEYCHPLAQSSCPACHYKPSQLAGPDCSIFNSPSRPFSRSKNPYWPSERTSHIDILTLHGPVIVRAAMHGYQLLEI